MSTDAMMIDCDGHILEPPDLWERYLEPRYRDRAIRIRVGDDGYEYLEIDGRRATLPRPGQLGTLGGMGKRVDEARRLRERATSGEIRPEEVRGIRPGPEQTYLRGAAFGTMDMAERVQLLDREGMAKAILYPTIGLLWEAELMDPELSGAYCRAYNRWIADFCRGSKGRLIPIAHLSLGNPTAAAAELERAVKDGCRGAFVVPFASTHKAHGDPVHDAIYAKAVELDVPIAIHPAFEPFELRSPRFENGHRLSLLAAATAGDGVRHAFTTFFDFATFDRFPKLKLVLLESGAGWIGYWLDRLDGVATATFLGGRAPLKMKPSDYFRRQVWISGDPDERTLPAMMRTYGADRFFWASDYPHPDHTGDYLQALEEMVDEVPAPARAGLLGGNVRHAFGF